MKPQEAQGYPKGGGKDESVFSKGNSMCEDPGARLGSRRVERIKLEGWCK